MSRFQHNRIKPAQVVILGFLIQILVGACLLTLPVSTQSGEGASFLDALFTATSATCVTGLVVQDTAQFWSPFGQGVILLLIQIGGMGVVTMAVAISIFSGRKIGLRERWVMQESISAPQVGGIVRMTGFILKTALAIEAIGALVLALRFCPEFGLGKGIWYGIFHAVLGGLGFLVWQDVAAHRWHVNRYRLQSKLVLSTTALLLVGGGLFYGLYEFAQPQWADLSGQERGLAALFQSVSPRTAGFNTVDLTLLSAPTLLVTILLMLAGGSPGSTAGGFKTTTLAVLFLAVLGVFRRQSGASAFGRRLPEVVIRNACALFVLYLTLFLTGGLLLCCVEGIPLMSALFEAASAIGTVGLTLGVTTELSSFGQLILIFLMYFGRVGGLTMIYAMTARPGGPASQYPQEQVTVG